jgi:hypothetical protein
MPLITSLTLVLALIAGQTGTPSYVREGDRVEQEFELFRNRLNAFFISLRSMIDEQPTGTSVTLPRLQSQDAPPPVTPRFGFGVLPRIVEDPPPGNPPVSVFSYSWPITDGYIAGEKTRLDQAEAELQTVSTAAGDAKLLMIRKLILEYRTLVANQRTIDQYIQYNEFWQRAIAEDRPRFDQLTKVYELLKADEPDLAQAIREVLGKPSVPDFIQIDESVPGSVAVNVPVYTDIEDDNFLNQAKGAVERMWRVEDGGTAYSVHIEFRKVPPAFERGTRIDIRAHAAGFPEDGAVFTTGAQTTHSLVGRYIALAPGDLSARTIAHEFGHLLGFRDGYIRGYRDLGERGFEILELTSVFDDIMSAPREGHVRPAHFKLLIEAARPN